MREIDLPPAPTIAIIFSAATLVEEAILFLSSLKKTGDEKRESWRRRKKKLVPHFIFNSQRCPWDFINCSKKCPFPLLHDGDDQQWNGMSGLHRQKKQFIVSRPLEMNLRRIGSKMPKEIRSFHKPYRNCPSPWITISDAMERLDFIAKWSGLLSWGLGDDSSTYRFMMSEEISEFGWCSSYMLLEWNSF